MISKTIVVIGVPSQNLFIVVIMHRVQFISANSVFEKDQGSWAAQLR